MEVALPASVDFSRRQPELPDSTTSTLTSVSPNNGLSFVPGQQITFDLPSQPGLYIDGKSLFIRYKVEYTSTAGTAVIRRKPVYTNFSRLDEYIGGVPVNSIAQYNQVANMYVDLNYSISDVYGQQFSWGLKQSESFADLDGVSLSATAANNVLYVAAPLVCSFLQGTDKLFPTGAAAAIRIQLTVDTIANICNNSSDCTAITISSPELCFSAINMGSHVDAMAFSAAPQLFLKTRCWANGTQGMPSTSSGQMSLVFNHRYASIENLYFLSTSSATAKAANLWGDSFNPMGINDAAGSLQITIGQSQYPQLPIYNLTGGRGSIQQYAREATGTLTDQRNTMAILQSHFSQYAGNSTVSTTELPAKFYFVAPLSRLNPPSPYQQTSLLAGVSAQSTPIVVNLVAGTAFNSNMVFNLIAEYSQLIVIDPATRQVSVIN